MYAKYMFIKNVYEYMKRYKVQKLYLTCSIIRIS